MIRVLSGSLATAVSSIGSTTATLIIDAPAPVSSNLTIPPNLSLVFIDAGTIVPASGVTVTIQGSIESAPTLCFDISSGGIFSFSGNIIQSDFNIAWWGPATDGSTDSQPAWQAAVSALETQGQKNIIISGSPNYALASTITINATAGHGLTIKAQYEANLGADQAGARFTWTGSAHGTVFDCYECRGLVIEGINIAAGAADRGVSFNGFSPAITTANTLRNVTIWNSAVNSAWAGAAIENTSGNNGEFHVFDQLQVYTSGGTAGSRAGVGLYIDPNANDHGHVLRNCRFYGGAAGVRGAIGFTSEGVNSVGANDIDLDLTHQNYPWSLEYWDTENSRQFLKTGPAVVYGVIANCRLQSQAPSGSALISTDGNGGRFQFKNNNILQPTSGGFVFDFDSTVHVTYIDLVQNDYGASALTDIFKNQPTSLQLTDDFQLTGYYRQQQLGGGNTTVAVASMSPRGCVIGATVVGATSEYDAEFKEVSSGVTLVTLTPGNGAFAFDFPYNSYDKAITCTLFGDNAWSTSAAGNIAAAVSVAAGRSLALVYCVSKAKWYPML